MSMWTAIVVIVAIVTWGNLRAHRHYGRRSFKGSLESPDDQNLLVASPREHELEREVSELRKRLEVLERIATDDRKSRDLAEEIDRLR